MPHRHGAAARDDPHVRDDAGLDREDPVAAVRGEVETAVPRTPGGGGWDEGTLYRRWRLQGPPPPWRRRPVARRPAVGCLE
jgi:hypothetical protein